MLCEIGGGGAQFLVAQGFYVIGWQWTQTHLQDTARTAQRKESKEIRALQTLNRKLLRDMDPVAVSFLY